MTDYAKARLNMVDGQVKPNRVTDNGVLDALLEVPRELFVPKALRGIAYVDEDICIGGNRYLMEPMVLARLLNEAQIRRNEVVLDIGCATGYSTAVIARLANTVVGLESDPDMARQAGTLLSQIGVDNAVVVTGPLTDGYAAQGPYGCIVLNGAVAEVPEQICSQLAEGGRLAAVVRPPGQTGRAVLWTRVGGALSRRELFDAATPILPGFEPRPAFVF